MRLKDLPSFYGNTARLLEAGLSLPEALSHLAAHASPASKKRALAAISARVTEGQPLHEALAVTAPQVAGDHRSLLSVAEAGGRLPEVLTRLSDQVSRDRRARRKLIAAGLYPAFILALLAAAGVGFSRWVLPGVAELAVAMDPAAAEELRLAAERTGGLVKAGIVLTGVLGCGGVLWHRLSQSDVFMAETLDRGLLYVPLFGTLLRSRRLTRLFFTVETLLGAGVTAEDAFLGARETANGRAWKADCTNLARALQEGRALTDAAGAASVLSSVVLERLAAVEAGASLATVARDLRLYFEEDVEDSLETLTRAAEPALITVAGLAFALFVAVGVLPVLRSYGALSF